MHISKFPKLFHSKSSVKLKAAFSNNVLPRHALHFSTGHKPSRKYLIIEPTLAACLLSFILTSFANECKLTSSMCQFDAEPYSMFALKTVFVICLCTCVYPPVCSLSQHVDHSVELCPSICFELCCCCLSNTAWCSAQSCSPPVVELWSYLDWKLVESTWTWQWLDIKMLDYRAVGVKFVYWVRSI